MNRIKMTPEISGRLVSFARKIEMINDDTYTLLTDMFETAQVQPTDDIPVEIDQLMDIRECLTEAYEMLFKLASPF